MNEEKNCGPIDFVKAGRLQLSTRDVKDLKLLIELGQY